jgi:hypothetical protein
VSEVNAKEEQWFTSVWSKHFLEFQAMVNFGDLTSVLNVLSVHLSSHKHSNPNLGFMVESLKELLKAFMYAKDLNQAVVEGILEQYTTHIAEYVTMEAPLKPRKEELSTSLVNVIGTDLCDYVLSDFLCRSDYSNVVYVCKTLSGRMEV